MKMMLIILVIVLLVVLSTIAWQHLRYLDARRNNLQDQQPMLYANDAFHAITFFAVKSGESVIDAARTFVDFLEQSGVAKVIYVGQAAFSSGTTSVGAAPVGAATWSGVVMMQYPSRSDFEALRQQESYGEELGRFARTYTHGMRRPQWTNILLHQGLLIMAIRDWLSGHRLAPLEPMPDEMPGNGRGVSQVATRLRAMSEINDEALVVVNLQRPGTPEQQANDRKYTSKMIARMARGGHGPMHVGEAVTLEGDADFDRVAIVYYPGATYFANLISSGFFQGIIGDKQLGANLAVPTVPILRQVRQRVN